jgi:hypothetical protein
MKPRFELDSDSGSSLQSSRLVDPEAYDASEQEFAASLEGKAAPRFVVEAPENLSNSTDELAADLPVENALASPDADLLVPEVKAVTVNAQSEPPQDAQPDSWRREVAARVTSYRSRRRPRAPRYPSLLLKFDFPENGEEKPGPTSGAQARDDEAAGIAAPNRRASQNQGFPTPQTQSFPILSEVEQTGRGNLVRVSKPEILESDTNAEPDFSAPPVSASAVESSARILEFPRSAMGPPCFLDELAEPIFDRPRILDVPEPLPPPPALGGISIEPGEQPETGKRPGFELPLQPAPRARRLLAACVDVTLVLAAFAVFAAIFFKITSIVPPLRLTLEFSLVFVGVLWATYQYGLLVYCGTTPGLKAARLRLSEFDGSLVPRKLRRWRVIASILSGASLALGYAWYFLDEDHLCWHDRITHTYMAPVGK